MLNCYSFLNYISYQSFWPPKTAHRQGFSISGTARLSLSLYCCDYSRENGNQSTAEVTIFNQETEGGGGNLLLTSLSFDQKLTSLTLKPPSFETFK
jgi:hypothetical protein